MSSLKCNTREYSGTNKMRLYFHMDRVHLPRCVHGPVAPAEARCPPRRPVAPTAMLETHSDAMLTTTRASPAMAVLALLDEIEDLLGSRQARSTTSSICRTVESNLCMHAVPVHLRQSRPSSKEAVPVRSRRSSISLSSKQAAPVLRLADVDDLLTARSVSNRDHLEIEASSVRTLMSFVKVQSSALKCNPVQSSAIKCNQRTWVLVKCSMMSSTCGEEASRRRGEHWYARWGAVKSTRMRGAPRRSVWGESSGAAGRSTSSSARRLASRASHAPPATRPERRSEMREAIRKAIREAMREAIREAIREAVVQAISGNLWQSVALTLTIEWQWYKIC